MSRPVKASKLAEFVFQQVPNYDRETLDLLMTQMLVDIVAVDRVITAPLGATDYELHEFWFEARYQETLRAVRQLSEGKAFRG